MKGNSQKSHRAQVVREKIARIYNEIQKMTAEEAEKPLNSPEKGPDQKLDQIRVRYGRELIFLEKELKSLVSKEVIKGKPVHSLENTRRNKQNLIAKTLITIGSKSEGLKAKRIRDLERLVNSKKGFSEAQVSEEQKEFAKTQLSSIQESMLSIETFKKAEFSSIAPKYNYNQHSLIASQSQSFRPLSSSTKQLRSVMRTSEAKTTKVLPKELRLNPFAPPPVLNEKDLAEGIYNLQNRGLIPPETDVSAAFDRAQNPLRTGQYPIKQPIDVFGQSSHFKTSKKIKKGPFFDEPLILPGLLEARKKKEQQTLVTAINIQEKSPKGDSSLDKRSANDGKTVKEKKAQELNALAREHLSKIEQNSKKLRFYYDFQRDEAYYRFINSHKHYSEEINELLGIIRITLRSLGVTSASISSESCLKLLESDKYPPSREEIISALVTHSMIDHLLEVVAPEQRNSLFQNREANAAKAIQGWFRCVLAKRIAREKAERMKSIKFIQSSIRSAFSKLALRKKMEEERTRKVQRNKERVQRLGSEWEDLKVSPHFEIHIPSLGLDEFKRITMTHFAERQNEQMLRLIASSDPNISVIYVCPYEMKESLRNGYLKFLEHAGMKDPASKVHFIVPSCSHLFSSRLPLSSVLWYSGDTLKQIKEIVGRQNAYIVPGIPNMDDLKIADWLGVPLLSGDPEATRFFQRKHFAMQLFEELNLPVLEHSEFITDGKDLLDKLIWIILAHPETRIWVLKIDDEFSGRGCAVLNTEGVGYFEVLRKDFPETSSAVEQKRKEMKLFLRKYLPNLLQVVADSLYSSFTEFISAFVTCGGHIEAYPSEIFSSINLRSLSVACFIAPSGDIAILCTAEKLNHRNFQCVGYSFPVRSIFLPQMETAAKLICERLHSNLVAGYVTIDFLINEVVDNPKMVSSWWTMSVNCGFSVLNGILNLVSMLLTEEELERRNCIYFPHLCLDGLKKTSLSEFMAVCKKEGVFFEGEKKSGIIYLPYRSESCEIIGMLIVSHKSLSVFHQLNQALKFMSKNYQPKTAKKEIRTDLVDFGSIRDLVEDIDIRRRK